MFGFDEHSQPVYFFPLQLVQLRPKIVLDKVQLFGKFALLQNGSQHGTVQQKSINSFQNSGILARQHLDVIHVGVLQLLSEMGIFFEVLDDFPEIAVIVQPRVLRNKNTPVSPRTPTLTINEHFN